MAQLALRLDPAIEVVARGASARFADLERAEVDLFSGWSAGRRVGSLRISALRSLATWDVLDRLSGSVFLRHEARENEGRNFPVVPSGPVRRSPSHVSME